MSADGSSETTQLCRVVNRTDLDLFSLESESWGASLRLSDAIEARNSAFLLVPGLGALCIGGYDAKYSTFLRDAFAIGVDTGHVRLLPHLSHSRCGIGLFHHSGSIYAFGGRDVKLLPVSERLSLSDPHWTELPGMQSPRAYFNPVMHDGNVYLCGGLTTTCEVFSIDSCVFSQASFTLPEASESLAFAYLGGIAVLTSRFLSLWTGGECTSEEMRVNCCKASCGPVVSAEGKLFVVCEGQAWKIDLQGKSVEVVGKE